MKYTAFILLVFVALANAEEWIRKVPADINVYRAECLKETPVSDENIKKMTNLEFPDEESVRKYVLCTAKKIGIFSEKHGFYPERIAQQFRLDMDEDEVLKLATDCADKNEQKSSSEVWAYRGHQCLMSGKIGDRVREYIRKKNQEH